jgi:hypothetical protein
MQVYGGGNFEEKDNMEELGEKGIVRVTCKVTFAHLHAASVPWRNSKY